MPLYRRHANKVGFPDVRTLTDRLGLAIDGNIVELQRDAELAHIRDAITGRVARVASRQEQAIAGETRLAVSMPSGCNRFTIRSKWQHGFDKHAKGQGRILETN